MAARTPESLYDELYVAVERVLSSVSGQFTSWHDGYLSAPDVRGVRVRLVLEIDPATARGAAPRGTSWRPRPDDPPHDARPPAPAATQRGLFDQEEP